VVRSTLKNFMPHLLVCQYYQRLWLMDIGFRLPALIETL